MFFGPVPVQDAIGGILVHSVRFADGAVRKGTVIGQDEIERLRGAGIARVVIARLDAGDVSEDEAALALAQALAGAAVRVEPAFTGRSNLFADVNGVLRIDNRAVDHLNGIDEAVTLATLPALRAVERGEMIGTVKIIPFAIPGAVLSAALGAIGASVEPVISVAAFRPLRVGVVSTLLAGIKPSVVRKTVSVLADRLAPAGASIVSDHEVAHETAALSNALALAARDGPDLLVVFGASAITDRRDVIPAAIEACGGRVEHFGMPVDPGNLLLIGSLNGRPVLGAPGCARSPKENGFDWVLQRLLAGLPVGRAEIVAMGVGGLLMEIVQRGQLRQPDSAREHG